MEKQIALLSQLKGGADARQTLETLLQSAQEQHITKPHTTIHLCKQIGEALTVSPELSKSHQDELIQTYLLLGHSYRTICDHTHALSAFQQACDLLQTTENQAAVGACQIQIAEMHIRLDNFSEALLVAYRVLDTAQQLRDKNLEGQTLNTIGLIYLELSEPARALSFLHQSVDILESSGVPENLAKVNDNFCLTHLNMGAHDKALVCGQQAVTIYQEIGRYHEMAEALIHTGQVYHAKGDLPRALKSYEHAHEIACTYQYQCHDGTALFMIGRLQVEQQEFQEAQNNLEQSLRLTRSLRHHPTYGECHRLLSELFARQKKFQQALKHHQLYHAHIHHQYTKDFSSRVKVLELAYNLETTTKISEALQEQNKALREEVRLRKQAQARLEDLSRLDPLTGIYNRRYFFELAEREFTRSRRYARQVSVIMIDLDYFKAINDTHGHAVGDQVLTEIAQRIEECVRKVDIACRYGGEEFLVLLPETGLAEASVLAQRIWNTLTSHPTSTKKLTIPVQASIGVACTGEDTSISLDELIDEADKALYRAKDLGRNRIELFIPDKA
jgi:diguanylate cyclase (GGDEF)-like protein